MGNWKNYDELEDQLSVEELVATLQAQRKMKRDEQKFFAAIQGIEIPDDNVVQSDITDLRGFRASQEGFGIGKGLSHSVVEVVEA